SHFNLGLGYKTKGHLDDAVACFKKAVELVDPKEARARAELQATLALRRLEAVNCAFRREWKKAADVYARHLDLLEADARGMYARGALRLLRGDEEGHRRACARMMERIDKPGADPFQLARAAVLCGVPEQNPDRLARLAAGRLKQGAGSYW